MQSKIHKHYRIFGTGLTILLTLIQLFTAASTALATPSHYAPDPPPQMAGMKPHGTNMWTWQGPEYNQSSAEAPQINEIIWHPTNEQIVYAGTNQGVYRSSNGGDSWEPHNGGLGGYGDLVVTSLAIDPMDPNTIIIGTWGYGLLKSTDGGENWSRMADPLEQSALSIQHTDKSPLHPIMIGGPSDIYTPTRDVKIQGEPITWRRTALREVALNPNNPDEIYACVDDGYGLFRSTDGGNSWGKMEDPPGSGSARTFTFAPSNPDIRFASFGSWGSSGGFYRTTNGGETWTSTGEEIIEDTVVDVAIHPTNANVIIAGTAYGGLYRSIDSGDSWTRVGESLSDITFYSVVFAPSNPSIVYAGGYTSIYMSYDGGKTWTTADSSFPTGYIEGLAIHPSDPETVLVGAKHFPRGGVYKRTDSSDNFSLKATGMTDTFVLDIEQDPIDPDILYAATWGAGIFRSDDGGKNWDSRYTVPYVYTIHATEGPTGTILYAGTFYSDYGILKSYDRGNSWTQISRDYPSYISLDITTIYDDPDRLVAATFNGIEYSYDGGKTWYGSGGLEEGIILHLCEFPGTGRMLAATYGGGLFYSRGGYSWYEANVGLPDTQDYYQYTYDIACSPDVEGLAYAGGLGVYRTQDYGEHWQIIGTGLPNDYIRAVDIVPGTGDVFAGTNKEGVYLAPRGIPVWSAINTGLVEKRIRAVKVVDSSPIRAFLGTNGMSAWDYTLTSRPDASVVYLPVVLKTHTATFCYTYEPNDNFGTAKILSPGTHCSYISNPDDDDYYRLNVKSLGQIDIELTNIPDGADYELELFDGGFEKLAGSYWGSNHPEKIHLQPIQTGTYYVRVYSYSDYSTSQGYHLSLSFNSNRGAGQIYGTLTEAGKTLPGVPVELLYYNGYKLKSVTTLTDGSGIYRFRGMPSLPVGHYYQVHYPNMERDSSRLGYWYCHSLRDYVAGESVGSCSPNVENVDLVSPAGNTETKLPVTFQWNSRTGEDDNYQVYLRRYSPSYAYYYAPSTTGDSYTLNSLPSGFNYDDQNYWSVNLYNDIGHGASYYMRSIIFTNAMRQQQTTRPLQLPNCSEETNEKDCLWLNKDIPSK
jgi:photosystem II stability/assembly factor-like uncharacterized protein